MLRPSGVVKWPGTRRSISCVWAWVSLARSGGTRSKQRQAASEALDGVGRAQAELAHAVEHGAGDGLGRSILPRLVGQDHGAETLLPPGLDAGVAGGPSGVLNG